MKVETILIGFICSSMLLTGGYILGQKTTVGTSSKEEARVEQKKLNKEPTPTHSHVHNLPHSHKAHKHTPYEIKSDESLPEVSIDVQKDPKSGWNLKVMTQNFKFSGKNASLEHVSGQGHAHLYIDNKKVTRLYASWFYIPEMEKGERVIKVSLNTNDHKTYSKNGKLVEAIQKINVL